jgi:HAE1 family hydrophobic/amphiphilic exporter-1
MNLADIPLKRPVATVMVLLSLTVLGTVAVSFMPVDFIPVVQEPEIDIEVPFPGSHPLEGLRQVVKPIEEEVATIPGVKAIYGFVNPGRAQVEVQFDWSEDIEMKKAEVREAVERARPLLPDEIDRITVEGDTDGMGAEVLNGRISANRDLSESWDLLDRRIRQPLERISGVASVELYGVEAQQLRVDLDLVALKRHEISVGEVIQRVNAANLDLDLGSVRGDVLSYEVRSVARFRDVRTVRDLTIGGDGVRLSDVAVVDLREPVLDYGRHLNRNFAIGFDINKEPSANTVETVSLLKARIEEIRRDPELEGIEVLVWEDAAEAILNSIEGLRNAGIFGGLLAVGVLFLFLRRVSTTLIVAVAIPFSLLVTCGAMLVLGRTFNVLSMLGLMLGVGMLVDNAVVVIENIYRLQGQGMAPRQAAREGTRQVSLAVTAATATTIIVWSWLFVAEPSTMTIYITEVALIICLAVACSLLISLSGIPLAAARFVPDRKLKLGWLMTTVVPRYRNLLGWTLRHRAVTLLALMLLAGSAAIPVTFIEKTDEPRFQQRDVLIHYEVHDPSTKEVVEGYVDEVEAWLETRRDDLGFESIYSYYGRQWGAGTRVYLPRDQSTEDDLERLKAGLREGLPVIPGVELEIGDQRRRHRGPRQAGTARIALHGEDPEYLEQLAMEAERRFTEMEDVVEVYGPSLVGEKEVRVQIDPERARRLGVSPQRVADAVSFVFRGQQLRRFQGERGEVDLIVGLAEDEQPGLAALNELPIPTDRDDTVALGALAEVTQARTPPRIRRVDRKTTSWVTVQFEEEAVPTPEAKKRMTAALADMQFPEGYSWDWGERMHREGVGLNMMLRGVILSLIAVLLLMAALFESFTQPLAILVTLPLALFGAFWTLWIFGFVFEVLAFIGVIMLIGVVVNNGIVMVDHVNSLRRSGMEREQALIVGCGDRLRPVLMTAITTVFGLIPLTFSQFTVAGVYIQSMAAAMMGGLISSTIFTLVALPVWYTAVEDLGAVIAGLFPAKMRSGRFGLPTGGILVSDRREAGSGK